MVRNHGPESQLRFTVPNRSPESRFRITVPIHGPKSQSRITVPLDVSSDSDSSADSRSKSPTTGTRNQTLNESNTWMELLRTISNESTANNQHIREEVDRYLKEKLRPQSEDPLLFWKAEHGRYPKVATLVRRYLCQPPSSVASERAFSLAKRTLGDHRQRA